MQARFACQPGPSPHQSPHRGGRPFPAFARPIAPRDVRSLHEVGGGRAHPPSPARRAKPPTLLRNSPFEELAAVLVDEGVAEVMRAPTEGAEGSLALAGFVGGRPGVRVDEVALEATVDENGELAGGGGDRLCLPDTIGKPSVESPQRGLRLAQGVSQARQKSANEAVRKAVCCGERIPCDNRASWAIASSRFSRTRVRGAIQASSG